MRKRLQRIRDKLRKEMEVAEQRAIRPDEIRADLPAKVVELLARPKLTDLPENPVGKMLDLLRSAYPEFVEQSIPELVDLAEARKTIANEAMYIDPVELHRVDDHRILRYDLTLPLLLTVRYDGQPLRIWTAGKCYRLCQQDAMHLEAFHQAEVLWMDERARLDPWQMTGRVLRSVDQALPGRTVKIVPTEYAMCSQAWELEVDEDGRWNEVLAWGVYSDRIVRHLGGDPAAPYRRRCRLRTRTDRDASVWHRRRPKDRRRERRVTFGTSRDRESAQSEIRRVVTSERRRESSSSGPGISPALGGSMKRNDPEGIDERAYRFYCDVVAFVETVPIGPTTSRIIGQLLDAAGSIGSNREEALSRSSTREIIHFNEISLRGANDSVRWLRACTTRRLGSQEKCVPLVDEGQQLARLLTRVLIRAKRDDESGGRKTGT